MSRHCVFLNKIMLYLLTWDKFFLKIISSTHINMRKRWVITRCIFCFVFESVLTVLKFFWCFRSQHFSANVPKIKTKSETLQLILGCIWIVSGLTALKNLISINLFHILCRNKKRFILECNILDEKVCNEVEYAFDN